MKKSACFTGHRSISADITELSKKLYALLERMIVEQGLTEFYSGGAIGFDTITALIILQLREKYSQIKIHLILPCPNEEQTINWTTDQISDFLYILSLADSVEYTSEHLYNGCMKVRNARLVEYASECCICYWNENRIRSGTGQTVRMARRKGIEVINLFYENRVCD